MIAAVRQAVHVVVKAWSAQQGLTVSSTSFVPPSLCAWVSNIALSNGCLLLMIALITVCADPSVATSDVYLAGSNITIIGISASQFSQASTLASFEIAVQQQLLTSAGIYVDTAQIVVLDITALPTDMITACNIQVWPSVGYLLVFVSMCYHSIDVTVSFRNHVFSKPCFHSLPFAL